MSKHQKVQIKLGIERLLGDKKTILKNQKVGLICNPASVNNQLQHAADLFFHAEDINLEALFGPQHGIRGDVQDNMVETVHTTDPNIMLPVYSLYSETRKPSKGMLSGIDTLVFDLQDVGCRVYTFIYTMSNAMSACAESGKKFVICDRPNPINGLQVEGNVLEKGHESFVGQFPIPMRHGMTVGELAKLFNKEFSINCDLEVVEMQNWKRHYYFDDTNLTWVMPSPNMPTVDTSIVFPGTVFFEGTQISEGRGTTRPFEIVGAPFVNSNELIEALKSFGLEGVIFRPISFIPTFQKHANILCHGVFIHVTDRNVFKPVLTGITVLKAIRNLYPDKFKWKLPPYEYEFDRNPFDVIAGNIKLRQAIEGNEDLLTIKKSWEKEVSEFNKISEKYLMY